MSSFKVTHISAVDKRAIRYHVMDDIKKLNVRPRIANNESEEMENDEREKNE